jgi:hypothetical protein
MADLDRDPRKACRQRQPQEQKDNTGWIREAGKERGGSNERR